VRSPFRIRSQVRDLDNDQTRIERIRAVLKAVQEDYNREAEGLSTRIQSAQDTAAFLSGSEGPNFGTESRHSERLAEAERNLVRGFERLKEIETIAERLRSLEDQLPSAGDLYPQTTRTTA
jgi:hypothetical protein